MSGFLSGSILRLGVFPTSLVAFATLCSAAASGQPPAEPTPAPESVSVEPEAAEPAPDDVSLARDTYSRGVKAYEEQRYKDAIDLFYEADRLTPNPAFSFNIGIAYEEMGDPALALSHYRSYVRQAPHATDRNEVGERVERLELKLQEKGVQQVTILSKPSGATIAIDGARLGVTPWTGEIAPGHHRVSLQLRGYRDEVRDFDLPPARAIDVPVTLTEQSKQVAFPVSRAEAPSPVESASSLSEVSTLSWILLGSGTASLGAALVFELGRSAAEADARAEPVQIKAEPLLEKAEDREAFAVGFGIAGGALLAAGGVLAILDLTGEDEGELAARGLCSLRECRLQLFGSF